MLGRRFQRFPDTVYWVAAAASAACGRRGAPAEKRVPLNMIKKAVRNGEKHYFCEAVCTERRK